MRVNIAIESFNRLGLIRTLVESIKRHTHNIDFKVLILDGTQFNDPVAMKFYDELQAKYGFVEVLLGRDHFPLTTRNDGYLRSLDCKYYVELDDDMIVTPNWLERLVQPMEQDPNLVVTAPLMTFRGDLYFRQQVFLSPASIKAQLNKLDLTYQELDLVDKAYQDYLFVEKPEPHYVNILEMTCLAKRVGEDVMWDEKLDLGRQTFRANEDLAIRLHKNGKKMAVVRGVPLFHLVLNSWKNDLRSAHHENLHRSAEHFSNKYPGFKSITLEPWYSLTEDGSVADGYHNIIARHLQNTLRNDKPMDQFGPLG